MYNKVATKYSKSTADLGTYLRNRIRNAKDLNKLFTSLEKQNYTIEHKEVEDNFYGKCMSTRIMGNFNGNDWVVQVLYNPTNNTDNEFAQTLIGVFY